MTASSKRLHRAGDPYPVLLQKLLVDRAGSLLRRLWGKRRLAIVTQSRVRRLHGARLEASLSRAGLEAITLIMGAGEDRKNLKTVERLYDGLVKAGFTRDDAIVAFGGGAVGDTAGFTAATFLRGVRYAQIPTTLLAQIDSSVGAKVGVNLRHGKNLIGSIYRPSAVWIDPSLLETLPGRDVRSGLFELVKYGFIGVPRLLRQFERAPLELGTDAMFRAIGDGVRCKLDVVREDETELGNRRILNFGHTIGHGLEAASDYKLLRHGEAVGWGMVGAVRLAAHRGRMSDTLAVRLEALIHGVGPLPSVGGLSPARVMAAVRRDKKRSRDGYRFILPVGFGRVETVDVPESEIEWAALSVLRGR